jgi:hypothetical protein
MCSCFTLRAIGLLLLLALPVRAASGYTLETVKADPPTGLQPAIRALLARSCLRLKDADGDTLFEVWLRAEVPVKATEVQVKNGLTYQEVSPSTLLAAIRVVKDTTDYRKQKIPAGVYTLRLAIQPVSDDHNGTAPYREFGLLSAAGDDKKPDLMPARKLQDQSARITGEHPAVFLLFPGKGATASPKLIDKGKGHRVLLVALPAKADAIKGTLPLGLTLIGTSAAVGK